jgi:hypothetical protein
MLNSASAPRGIDLFIRLLGIITLIIGVLILYSTLTSVTAIGGATLLFIIIGAVIAAMGIVTAFAKIG